MRHIPQLAEDGLDMKNALSEFSDLIGVEVTDQFVSENNPLVVAGNQLLHSSGTVFRHCVEKNVVNPANELENEHVDKR